IAATSTSMCPASARSATDEARMPTTTSSTRKPARSASAIARRERLESAPYDHIAVCIDDSEPSQLALAEGRRLFELGASRLRVVHVVQSPLVFAGGWGGWVPDPDQLTEGARIWLQEQVKDIEGADPVLLEGYLPA